MSEWQEQLNTILSDPDAMSQIVSLAQSISGSGGSAAPPESAPPPPEKAPPERPVEPVSGLDPELLRRLTPIMREMNRSESSEAAALLLALRPFLSEKRREKVERAAQLARLIHLGKTFLITQGQEADGRV